MIGGANMKILDKFQLSFEKCYLSIEIKSGDFGQCVDAWLDFYGHTTSMIFEVLSFVNDIYTELTIEQRRQFRKFITTHNNLLRTILRYEIPEITDVFIEKFYYSLVQIYNEYDLPDNMLKTFIQELKNKIESELYLLYAKHCDKPVLTIVYKITDYLHEFIFELAYDVINETFEI